MARQLAGLPALARRHGLLDMAPKLWSFPSNNARERKKVKSLIPTVSHPMNGSGMATAYFAV